MALALGHSVLDSSGRGAFPSVTHPQRPPLPGRPTASMDQQLRGAAACLHSLLCSGLTPVGARGGPAPSPPLLAVWGCCWAGPGSLNAQSDGAHGRLLLWELRGDWEPW